MTRGRKRLPSEQRAATKKIKRDDSPTEHEETSVHEKVRRLTTPPLTDPSVVPEANVNKVVYGQYEIDAWYHSPYPSDFGPKIDRLYICEYCLRYMNKESQLASHKAVCKEKKPPGKVVYAHEKHKIYEIDGQEHKFYCQNLCLLSKLFLDNKTLYFDVEGFKFYVLTEKHAKFKSYEIFVGMFSKEKVSYDNYNLACIMTLPCYQRKGYGKLLIEFSKRSPLKLTPKFFFASLNSTSIGYELSKHEGKVGSPEKPLSPLGSLGYQSYWSSTLVATLLHFRGQVTIEEICKETCIHEQDVIDTLSRLDMLRYKRHKEICITEQMLQDTIVRRNINIGRKLDPSLIRWR